MIDGLVEFIAEEAESGDSGRKVIDGVVEMIAKIERFERRGKIIDALVEIVGKREMREALREPQGVDVLEEAEREESAREALQRVVVFWEGEGEDFERGRKVIEGFVEVRLHG